MEFVHGLESYSLFYLHAYNKYTPGGSWMIFKTIIIIIYIYLLYIFIYSYNAYTCCSEYNNPKLSLLWMLHGLLWYYYWSCLIPHLYSYSYYYFYSYIPRGKHRRPNFCGLDYQKRWRMSWYWVGKVHWVGRMVCIRNVWLFLHKSIELMKLNEFVKSKFFECN